MVVYAISVPGRVARCLPDARLNNTTATVATLTGHSLAALPVHDSRLALSTVSVSLPCSVSGAAQPPSSKSRCSPLNLARPAVK
ncbi:hypothetical protein NL676_039550 [Syzygium grande]|nr:hypothetical protein NL676_039550 [Syzygium grande]